MNVVESWLDKVAYAHSGSPSTRVRYKQQLKAFCEFIDCSPWNILEEYETTGNERQFKRKYARLIRSWIGELSRKLTVGSVIGYVSTVRSFFKYNDLPLGYVPTGQYRITYHNRDIQHNEIADVLRISRPRDRAFFCMMAQSGLRPNTLSKLRRKHLEPDLSKGTIPCKIEVPEEISKGKYGSYFSFMGSEAVKYLKAYLATRGPLRPGMLLFTNHGTEKPLNTQSISGIFLRAINQLREQGLLSFETKKKGKPRSLRLYSLRKFFRKFSSHAGIEYTNFWMGHKTNYKAPHIPASDCHYFSREDVEFQRQLYKEKAMPNLRIEQTTPLQREQIMERQQEEIERLKKETASLRAQASENVELKQRMQQTETKLSEVEGMVSELKKMLEEKQLTE
jgi:integrase